MRVRSALMALVVVVTGIGAWARQVPPPETWQAADRATRRLPPSDFSELPPAVRADLDRRGCTIPQSWVAPERGNVVHGRFSEAASEDWAVLCSRDRVSTILVFWGGNPATVAALAERPDRDFLQVVTPGEIGFSRTISVATPETVSAHYGWYRATVPPALTHDGVDDAFVEKASVVWYWRNGQWVQLLGSD